MLQRLQSLLKKNSKVTPQTPVEGGPIPSLEVWEDHDERGIGMAINFLAAIEAERKPIMAKEDLAKKIVGLMEQYKDHPFAFFIFTSCMNAIANLSRSSPPLSEKLEAKLLQVTLSRLVIKSTESEAVCDKALCRGASEALGAMLKGLLSEAPTMHHLLKILEHFQQYMRSSDRLEKSQAIKATNYICLEAYYSLGLHYDLHEMREHLSRLWRSRKIKQK
ncbi:uncharacterized protein LOC128424228 isoform X1 [Podarcis raffonei]|uniref:uncharacterized protein LOC128424228 isoform X1 n=1 Tax=Podarcis raffonei TaxID=65483 RepID=UPI0023292AC4|nr:uncharacterized protein LOC128424228 isoform X1 [Podarcis raffonei]